MANFIGGFLWVSGFIMIGSTCDSNIKQMFIMAIGLALFWIGSMIITNHNK